MPRFKDQAICIRELDWAETSQIVVLMTDRHGKIRGLAKGSKRTSPSSIQRFSGGIELLTTGQIVATTQPASELATLTEWDLQNDYYLLRHDLAAQQLAMYGADLTGAMLADLDPHRGTFVALRDLLNAITQDEKGPDDDQIALLHFQWRLLVDCGYQPQLTTDVHSGEPLTNQPSYGFDPRGGGLTADQTVDHWRVRNQTVVLLRAIADNGPIGRTSADSVRRANRLLCAYIRAILDQQLPTMRFILNDRK